jgi:hypothetical protein
MDRQECTYQNGHETTNLTARLRWKLLAKVKRPEALGAKVCRTNFFKQNFVFYEKVLHDANKNGELDEPEYFNGPQFSTSTAYGLFACRPFGLNESCHEKCGNWFQYTCDISPNYSLSIR